MQPPLRFFLAWSGLHWWSPSFSILWPKNCRTTEFLCFLPLSVCFSSSLSFTRAGPVPRDLLTPAFQCGFLIGPPCSCHPNCIPDPGQCLCTETGPTRTLRHMGCASPIRSFATMLAIRCRLEINNGQSAIYKTMLIPVDRQSPHVMPILPNADCRGPE